MGTRLSTIEYCKTHSTIAVQKGRSQFEIKGIENGYVYFVIGKDSYHRLKLYNDERGQYFCNYTTKHYLNDFIFLNDKKSKKIKKFKKSVDNATR